MRNAMESRLTQAIDDTTAASSEAVSVTIVVVALVVLIALSLIIGRSVSGSLQQIISSLRNMASGEGDLTYRIEYTGKDELWDLYLNRSKALPNGQSAKPFELPEGNATRAEFHDKVTGRNDAQLKAFWSQQVFTGRGQPPAEAGSASGMKAQVASTPGAIGYIDSADVDDSVKVILTP
ncbi:ABC-type phosphate transport system substrate-binding protein [Marinobacter sp. MBR-105]|jgi:HAMP domain.